MSFRHSNTAREKPVFRLIMPKNLSDYDVASHSSSQNINHFQSLNKLTIQDRTVSIESGVPTVVRFLQNGFVRSVGGIFHPSSNKDHIEIQNACEWKIWFTGWRIEAIDTNPFRIPVESIHAIASKSGFHGEIVEVIFQGQESIKYEKNWEGHTIPNTTYKF